MCGALAGVSFLDVAASDSFECPCFFKWCIDVAGDAERFGVWLRPSWWADDRDKSSPS